MMRVPRTVPSSPFLSIAPRRQIITADAKRKRPIANQGLRESRCPACFSRTDTVCEAMLFQKEA